MNGLLRTGMSLPPLRNSQESAYDPSLRPGQPERFAAGVSLGAPETGALSPATPPAPCQTGVRCQRRPARSFSSLATTRHLLEMYRRQLRKGIGDCLAKRLTKIATKLE